MMSHNSSLRIFGATVAVTLCAGCGSFTHHQAVATRGVRIEREGGRPTITPAQRGQAYRDAFEKGARLAKEGQFGLAIGDFQEALDVYPESTEALFNLGACHEAIGDPLRAINCYRRVLDAHPDDADCYRNLGTSFIKLYYRENSPAWRKMAQEAWRHSLAINADQPDVRGYLAHEPGLD